MPRKKTKIYIKNEDLGWNKISKPNWRGHNIWNTYWITFRISNYLYTEDVLNLIGTCKFFYHIFNDNEIWRCLYNDTSEEKMTEKDIINFKPISKFNNPWKQMVFTKIKRIHWDNIIKKFVSIYSDLYSISDTEIESSEDNSDYEYDYINYTDTEHKTKYIEPICYICRGPPIGCICDADLFPIRLYGV